jgi:hypothetical protein
MTTDSAKQTARDYRWPLIVAGLGGICVVAGLSWDAARDPAMVGGIISGIISGVQWLVKRGEKKTVDAVTIAVDYQKLLAALAIGERLDSLQGDLNDKQRKNVALLSAISQEQQENARLHAEHIAVTDSHAAGLLALEGIAKKVDDTFQLPALRRRQSSITASEAGDAERAA